MWVERVDVRGYGRLTGRIELGTGLTLVTGPNEAGKSTLHELLVHGLFGFAPEDRRRRDGRSAKVDRAPWSGGPFGAVLTVTSGEGRRWRIDWDFAEDAVTAMDADTGAALLREQPRQREDYRAGPELVGLTRDEFRQIGCLFQESLSTVRSSEPLNLRLQRAVEASGGEDVGVVGADLRLRSVLSRIGVNAGHYGPIANGRLRQEQERITTLERALEESHADRQQLDELAAELAEARATCVAAGLRRAVAQRAVLQQVAAAAESSVRDAERLLEEASVDSSPVREVSGDVAGRIARALEARAVRCSEEDAASREVSEGATARRELEQRLREAIRARERLDAYRDVQLTSEADVRRAMALLDSAEPVARAAVTRLTPDGELQRFREQRDSIIARAAAGTARWRVPLVVTGVLLMLLGVTSAALVSPVMLVVAAAGAVVLWRARWLEAVDTDAPLADFGGRSFSGMDAAARDEEERLRQADAERIADEQRRDEQDQRRSEALLTLRDALGEDSAEPVTQAAAFLEDCDRHRAWADGDRIVRELESEARRAREPLERQARARGEVELIEAELTSLFQQAGVDAEDLDEAGRLFAADETVRQQARESEKTRAAAQAELARLLDGRTPQQLDEAASAAAQALREHDAAHPDLDVLPPHRDPALALSEASEDEQQAKLEEQRLSTSLAERESQLDSPADLEVELAEARAALAEIELLSEAVRIAREGLAAAAAATHRRVAPVLNSALRRELPRVTRGRYAEAVVADDLTVKLEAPESGRLVDVERLSRGTRDQVALIQRLEISKLLDPTGGGAPLLLDDPFAHTDDSRLLAALELLAELARTRQVILFTEDERLVDLAASTCGSFHHLALTGPGVADDGTITPPAADFGDMTPSMPEVR